MDATRHARIGALYREVRRLPRAEAARLLTQACAEDTDLRREVEELLEYAEDGSASDGFSEAALAEGRARLERAAARPVAVDPGWTPQSIGRYRIVRRIGVGGMGVVYEGMQEAPRRRVAVKVLHPLLVTEERVRRFRREVEVLGRLQHPGIAQVYEAGTADLGRGEQPWFAMELVEGVDLRTWAREKALDTNARLALVAEVADAVHHAHERGIVHRDLKPDNVLVDASGRPRVLDFGVARVTESSTTLSTMETMQGQIVGTLTYMAPEQLAGDPEAVSARSDVYALGVIAYELLVGRRPIDAGELPVSAAVPLLLSNEATRLGSIDARLSGDVETIVGKALEKDPERRYASAAAFAEDIRRHLAHRPIVARPPSVLYRATKFTRRHRGLVGGSAATLVTLLAGLAVALALARSERAQRRLADERTLEARRKGIEAGAALLRSVAVVAEQDSMKAARLLAESWTSERDWVFRHVGTTLPWILPVSTLENPVAGVKGSFSPEGDLYFVRNADLLRQDLHTGGDPTIPWPWLGVQAAPPVVSEAYVAVQCTDTPEVGVGRGDLLVFRRDDGAFARHVAAEDPGVGWWPRSRGEDVPFVVTNAAELVAWEGDEVRWRVSLPGFDKWASAPRWKWEERSPDGTRFAAVETPATLRLFDSQSGEELARRPISGSSYFTWSPDSGVIVVAEGDGRTVLLDGRTLENIGRAFGGPASKAAMSPDGAMLATFELDGWIRLWDVATGELERALETGPPTDSGWMIYSPDGRFLAAASEGFYIHVFDLSEPVGLAPGFQELTGPTSGIHQLALSPDGSLVAAIAPEDPHVYVWDLAAGRLLARVPRENASGPEDMRALLSFTRDGRALVFAGNGRNGPGVWSWDLASGDAEATSVEASSDEPTEISLARAFAHAVGWAGSEPFSAGFDVVLLEGGSVVWDPRDDWIQWMQGEDRRRSSTEEAWFVRPDPGRNRILIGTAGRTGGKLLALASPEAEPEYLLNERIRQVMWAEPSPEGKWLAIGTNDGRVVLEEREFGTRVFEWQAHPPGRLRNHDVRNLRWTPDGERLITASGDGTLRVWDSVRSFVRRHQRAEHEARVSEVTARGVSSDDPGLTPEERAAARVAAARRWGNATLEQDDSQGTDR